MTPTERRASASLASIFALRMLGLFLVLPVFALEARKYPGGEDPVWLGLAMGIYGLTQGLLQLPFGMASDRFGRKRVIVLGLLIFALGSFWAAAATDLTGLLVGRSLQGAGAVSAAVTALLADLTRDEVRTKAMALVGGSIGLMFALSLVVSPLLAAWIGLHGLFVLTGLLALLGVGVIIWGAPAAPAPVPGQGRGRLREVLAHADLMRLNVGVFVLHAVQLAMWVAVPALLVQAGLQTAQHWRVYLPAVLVSFLFLGVVFALERRGHLKKVFLVSIGLIMLVQAGLLLQSMGTTSLGGVSGLLLVFFCGFNALEATQPSLASRIAPRAMRGTAMGVYNTLQSLGFFVGGLMGGWLVKSWGSPALFLCCGAAMLAWLLLAWPMQTPGRSVPVGQAA
ncbi:MFS transporter [Limnohabitans sp. 2KL-1]|jgi:MFS family permease|uniref:MFS transporter n=1 Tax=Limnohabitans sp. 2KL-1 TaxID=1100699 RepID=UPI000D36FF27|nr:MFS transporter [Limnohabitans sp. 2KL-1]PUE46473.1 MFS transporter [Limnohabitans sp. 2KL-1]